VLAIFKYQFEECAVLTVPATAASITAATSFGKAIKVSWPPSTTVFVAFIQPANRFWALIPRLRVCSISINFIDRCLPLVAHSDMLNGAVAEFQVCFFRADFFRSQSTTSIPSRPSKGAILKAVAIETGKKV
jgi:hypothetical protein